MSEPKIPVVLLHGALRSSVGMWPTARFLARHGLVARGFDYATRAHGLPQHAERLAAFVRDWLGPRPPVLGFLTHSMGALVVRMYLGSFADELGAEQRVVMLSPPNRGSVLAARNRDRALFRWIYGRAAEVLVPERAQSLPPLPPTARALVLAGGRGDPRGFNPLLPGDDDGVVAVAEMGLPGVEPTFVGGLHATLQWRRAVLSRAAAFLAGE